MLDRGTQQYYLFQHFEPYMQLNDSDAGHIYIVPGDDANSKVSLGRDATSKVQINSQYYLPQAVTGTNDYVLTAQTDGTTAWAAVGGGIASLAADDTPQLGGDLDVDGNKITSASNADITIEPHGTGDILLYSDKMIVGDSSANWEIAHRTTTNSLLRFQTGLPSPDDMDNWSSDVAVTSAPPITTLFEPEVILSPD